MQGDAVDLLYGGEAPNLSPKFFHTAHPDSSSRAVKMFPLCSSPTTAEQPDKSSSLQCEKFRLNPKRFSGLTPPSPVSRGHHMPEGEKIIIN